MPAIKVQSAIETHEIVENFIKSLIESEASLGSIGAGFHNVFMHGDIFEKHDLSFNDEQLGKLFDGLDAVTEALTEIEKGNE